MAALLERIADRVEVGDCWLWTGAKTSADWRAYGQLWDGERVTTAHRVIYEALVGSIPDGYDLHHHCETRLCVNPDHLEPMPRGQNLRQSATVGKAHTRKTHCKRGHEFTETNTYVNRSGGRERRVCRECERVRQRGR